MDGLENCDKCGKPAYVFLSDNKGGRAGKLCFNCHNREMAEITGCDMPDIVPQKIAVSDKNGKSREFDLEFLILGNVKSLTATQVGTGKRKIKVCGNLDEDFNHMLDRLKKQIKKALSVKYLDSNGRFKDNKAVGYIEYNEQRDDHDVIIDGKPYTWEQLGENIPTFEGWKIKIEFAYTDDELY